MRILPLRCAIALPVPASAAAEGCFDSGVPLFHCSIDRNKQLDVCLQIGPRNSRFGPKAGVAELILARAVEDIYLRPLNGIGSSVYEELEFGAGDVTFREQYTLARIAAETPEITGDFTILSADESLADLTCDAGSVSDRDFEPQFTAKTNASQCWNPETFIWNGCL